MNNHSNRYLEGLVRELIKRPEQSWLEFKHNNSDAQEIGEYISALSNAAVLDSEANGYLVWGVDDKTHEIVGTKFSPATKKRGSEPLETWLLRHLEPKVVFRFHEVNIDEKRVILLEIPRATRTPVTFKNIDYIRVGEVKKKLKDFPEHERELWRALDDTSFEELFAAEQLSPDEVFAKLNCGTYFDRSIAHPPESDEEILNTLMKERLIQPCPAGGWNITNLGALLIAKKLHKFSKLERKTVRMIQYRGKLRDDAIQEKEWKTGYASIFEYMVDEINSILLSDEIVSGPIRKRTHTYPPIAIRELVANALIHQDLHETGAGPTIEIFDGRIEITNPGKPVVDLKRLVGTQPKSRNAGLALMMRRFGICEERGSGFEKVVAEIERRQMPAPRVEISSHSTRVKLFARKEFKNMDRAERLRACYLHACLLELQGEYLTNSSLRERFGIDKRNSSIVSRVINEAISGKAIEPYNKKDTSRRNMKYRPRHGFKM